MTQKKRTITEREERIIKWVSSLSDKELFGLECFLAGIRMTTRESLADEDDEDQMQAEKNEKGHQTNLLG